MTRADYRIRRDKLKGLSRVPHDDFVFQSIQIVTLGALFGLIGFSALASVMEQGR